MLTFIVVLIVVERLKGVVRFGLKVTYVVRGVVLFGVGVVYCMSGSIQTSAFLLSIITTVVYVTKPALSKPIIQSMTVVVLSAASSQTEASVPFPMTQAV